MDQITFNYLSVNLILELQIHNRLNFKIFLTILNPLQFVLCTPYSLCCMFHHKVIHVGGAMDVDLVGKVSLWGYMYLSRYMWVGLHR